jgi:hypothetical protein
VKAKDGNTQLYFDAPTGWSICLNAGLTRAFPDIDGGFNCPDY